MKRIQVKNLSKDFKIGARKSQGALAHFTSFFSGKNYKRNISVLKEVNFSVESGDIVGIIGNNASGKSTLLRLIAGIYKEDSGEIKTNGKIISLLNLNIGLKDKLTMKDNIYLCASLFGLSRKEIKESFASIVGFSELRDFINTKIYQFSEGMKQRLSFSIAVHCKPDILLLDEIFEIGDAKFKTKSVEKIKELTRKEASVILVSHELWMIEKYCNKVLYLDKSRIAGKGGIEIVKKYN